MIAIAVGGLDEQMVAVGQRLGVGQDRAGAATEIPREQDRLATALPAQPHLDHGGTEDVAGRVEPQRNVVVDVEGAVQRRRAQCRQTPAGLLLGVQGLGGIVLAVASLVGPARVFFLQVPGVGQQHAAQIAGRLGGEHAPFVASQAEDRKVARMVEVGVGQNHEIELGRLERRCRPVPQAEFLESLEQPAIDEHAEAVVLEQELRAGDGTGRAEEGQTCQRIPRIQVAERGSYHARRGLLVKRRRVATMNFPAALECPMKVSIEYCKV